MDDPNVMDPGAPNDPDRRERRIQTACLLALTVGGVAVGLYHLRPVLVPFVLSLFLMIALTPLVDVQVHRLRIPRKLAVAISLVLGFAVLGAVALVISVSVNQLLANVDEYQRRLSETLVQVARALKVDPDRVREILVGSTESLTALLGGMAREVTNIISQGVLVLLFLAFLLFGAKGQPSRGFWRQVEIQARSYLLTKALMSVATGVLTWLILWALGVPLAAVFGLLSFLLNFIPSIGSILATLLPLPMVLVMPDASWLDVVLVLALPGTVQFVIGNVLEPRMMGDRSGLHPITVLLALIFWGMLWGPIGMVLAVPLTAASCWKRAP